MQDEYDVFNLEVLSECSILYVEDDDLLREKMAELLRMIFNRVYVAENGRHGLKVFGQKNPDIVVTDIRMPVMDGLEMSVELKKLSPQTPIIITTAFSETEYLIRSIEIGVDRYVQKPIDRDLLLNALYKCLLPVIRNRDVERLDLNLRSALERQLGVSPQISEIVKQIRKVARTDFSVVLQGETGVGKSLVASLIHDLSNRSHKPFVPVDVGSIPETLVESELFGHKKGAFTGADKDKAGFLEAASGGTLFLDELENISTQVQAKLLRAVDEKRIYPLGSTSPVNIDVRFISATNVAFQEIVNRKEFREDLYYRLFEFDICIPPLRERTGDVAWLARRFCAEAAAELEKNVSHIQIEALDLLQQQEWPGNVRQLKNSVRRMVLLARSGEITVRDVKDVVTPVQAEEDTPSVALPQGLDSLSLEKVEIWAIRRALAEADGKRMRAAQLLDIDYKRLIRKMNKYQISY